MQETCPGSIIPQQWSWPFLSEASRQSKVVMNLLREEIVEALNKSLGREKAQEVVEKTILELGMDPESMDLEDALHVLDKIAAEPGIVGITARFVRSRYLLKQNQNP